MQLLMYRFVITGQNMRQGLDRFTLALTYYVIMPKCNEGQKLHTINNDLLTRFDFWNFYRVNHSQASILSIRVKMPEMEYLKLWRCPTHLHSQKYCPWSALNSGGSDAEIWSVWNYRSTCTNIMFVIILLLITAFLHLHWDRQGYNYMTGSMNYCIQHCN